MKQRIELLRSVFSNKILFSVCSMFFFYALFDGLVSYITPIAIKDAGYSNTVLGLILGFSSLAGAVFDFLLSKYLTNTHFRRVYLMMFAACAVYPLLLTGANTLGMFLAAMAVWGLYYDLNNFGLLDFVSRKFEENKRTVSFFLINSYTNFGYTIFYFVFAAGIVISVNWQTTMLLYVVLGLSFLFYLALLFFNRRDKTDLIPKIDVKTVSFFFEAKLWMKINKIIFPLLVLTMLFNITQSFFWTLGPLMAENMKNLQSFSESLSEMPFDNTDPAVLYSMAESARAVYPSDLILTVLVILTMVMICVFIFFRKSLGKIRTAYAIFYIGSLMMAFLYFTDRSMDVIYNIMFAFGFFSFAIPLLDSAYSDYIHKYSGIEKEIQGIRDFFINIGFVVGPVASGILADSVGYVNAFSFLGFGFMIIVMIALLLMSRKSFEPSL